MAVSGTAGTAPSEARTQSVKGPGLPRFERKIVQASVATPVLYYKRADPMETPVPALVIAAVGPDRNNLLVFEEGGTLQTPVRNVPHMSDPVLTTRFRKVLAGRPPLGGWDFNPDFVPERYRGLNAIHYRLVLLRHIHGYTAYQAAEAIGPPWNEDMVQAILNKHAAGEDGAVGETAKDTRKAAK